MLNVTLSAKTERALAKRAFQAFKDVNEVKELVKKLDHILRDFKVGDINQLRLSSLLHLSIDSW